MTQPHMTCQCSRQRESKAVVTNDKFCIVPKYTRAVLLELYCAQRSPGYLNNMLIPAWSAWITTQDFSFLRNVHLISVCAAGPWTTFGRAGLQNNSLTPPFILDICSNITLAQLSLTSVYFSVTIIFTVFHVIILLIII